MNTLKHRLKMIAFSDSTCDSTLIEKEEAKFILDLINVLNDIKNLPSDRIDEGSSMAFLALKPLRNK